ncbi:MAG: hypothetical protein JW888_00170 [Pirellulales bacterium]|nr:hypothetical protein [Pirellulales bacterium]
MPRGCTLDRLPNLSADVPFRRAPVHFSRTSPERLSFALQIYGVYASTHG